MANYDEYTCAQCSTIISGRAKLHCSHCDKLYHLECGNVTFKRYYLMNAEHRTQWKCNNCYEEQHQAVPITSNDTVLELPRDNVTQRKKFVINISTENSYGSLSVEDEEDSDTYKSPRTLLNRSCPELDTLQRCHLDEMKEKINQLQQQLNIAENEITNLLSQNHNLGKKVSKYEVKIKQLETICGSMKAVVPSGLSSTTKRTRKSLKKKALNFSVCEGNNDNNSEGELLSLVKINTMSRNNNELDIEFNELTHNTVPLTSSPLKNIRAETNLNKNTDADSNNRKCRVVVFSDEHGRGIPKILQKLLGHDFQVMSIIKPNASLNQILECCDIICKDFTDFDYVVFLAGSNDNSPLRFKSFLYYYISVLAHTNVLVSKIYKNKYLNEYKQNNTIKMVCSQFPHARFIETYQFRHNKLYISQSLLRDILNINFDVKYKYFIINQNKSTNKSVVLRDHVSVVNSANNNKLYGNKFRQPKINEFFAALPNTENLTPVLNDPPRLEFFRE